MATMYEGSDLLRRFVSGLAIAVVGLSALFAGGWHFVALCGLVSGLMTFELASLLTKPDRPFWPVLLGAGVFAGFTATWALASTSLLTSPRIFLLVALMALAPAIFIPKDRFLYVAFGSAVLVASLNLAETRVFHGVGLCGWLLLVVVSTDIAGYFFGKAFGGPRLAPQISPGKRWSGTCAGWGAAFLVSIPFVGHLGNWVLWAGIALSAASQVGDLSESWLKRRAKVKDSASLIPGHGGFCDRFDGMVGASLGLCFLDQANLVPVSMAT